MTVSEGDHTLRLGEAERVRVRAVVVSVVAPLAVVTVLAYWTVPDSMGRLKLFAEAASVREWKGSGGTTGLRVVVVVLWHGIPPETVAMSVFYGGG